MLITVLLFIVNLKKDMKVSTENREIWDIKKNLFLIFLSGKVPARRSE